MDAIEHDSQGMDMVTIWVAMPMRLKRKFHAEAMRRGQTLSEFICARCDFNECAGKGKNKASGGK